MGNYVQPDLQVPHSWFFFFKQLGPLFLIRTMTPPCARSGALVTQGPSSTHPDGVSCVVYTRCRTTGHWPRVRRATTGPSSRPCGGGRSPVRGGRWRRDAGVFGRARRIPAGRLRPRTTVSGGARSGHPASRLDVRRTTHRAGALPGHRSDPRASRGPAGVVQRRKCAGYALYTATALLRWRMRAAPRRPRCSSTWCARSASSGPRTSWWRAALRRHRPPRRGATVVVRICGCWEFPLKSHGSVRKSCVRRTNGGFRAGCRCRARAISTPRGIGADPGGVATKPFASANGMTTTVTGVSSSSPSHSLSKNHGVHTKKMTP